MKNIHLREGLIPPNVFGVVAVAICLTIWVAALRLPSFHFSAFDQDEALFLLIGQAWLEGGLPYVDIWDVKPPGLFLIFMIAEWIFGASVEAARLAAMAAVLAGAFGLFLIGRRWLDSTLAGCIAALAYPAYTILMNGLRGKAELFQMPFVIFACYLALTSISEERSWRARLFAAGGMGLCFGFAVHVKQTAAFEFAYVIGFVLAVASIGSARGLRRAMSLAAVAMATAAFVPMAFLCYFALAGAAPAFVDSSYLAPFLRLSGDDVTFVEGLLRFVPMFKPILPLLLGTCLVAAERARIHQSRRRQYLAVLFIFGWLLSSLPAIIAMRSMYGHYYLPLVPSMALLTGFYIARLLPRSVRFLPIARRNARITTAAVTVVLLSYPVIYFQGSSDARLLANDDLPRKVASRLAESGMEPGDRLYVNGFELILYLLADARPPTPYPFSMHLYCDFSSIGIDGAREIRRLFKSPPEFVIDVTKYNHKDICPLSKSGDVFKDILHTNYMVSDKISLPDGQIKIHSLIKQ